MFISTKCHSNGFFGIRNSNKTWAISCAKLSRGVGSLLRIGVMEKLGTFRQIWCWGPVNQNHGWFELGLAWELKLWLVCLVHCFSASCSLQIKHILLDKDMINEVEQDIYEELLRPWFVLFAEAVGLDTSRYSYFPAFAKIRINWRYVISCKIVHVLIYDEQNVVYLFSIYCMVITLNLGNYQANNYDDWPTVLNQSNLLKYFQ